MNVVVLAGAKSEGMGGALASGAYRAGMILGGRSMLEQVLTVLADLPDLQKLVVVGDAALIPPALRQLVSRVVPPGEELADNLGRGLAALPATEPALVAASDLPLLTKTALNDFVANCAKREADICYPVIRREVYESAYQGSTRTYLRVRDGVFTGGNVVLLKPQVFDQHRELIVRAVSLRKQPQRLGRLLGWGFVLGLALRRYTVAEIEQRVLARFGLRAVAVESRFSEMGFDVDSSEDVDWIQFYWGGATEAPARIGSEFDTDAE